MVVVVVFGTRVSETLGRLRGRARGSDSVPDQKTQHECNMNTVSLEPYGKNLDRS